MRYHNYMLFMLRKEREMETVTCANCGQIHLEVVSVSKTILTDREEVTHFYCGQACLQDHYLMILAGRLYE